MTADLFTLGVGSVTDSSTNKPIPATVRLMMRGGEDDADVGDYGDIPLSNALGVTALPAAADSTGEAEGIAVEVSTYGYACIGARDTRCADVVGKLKAGETCLHNTGGTAATRARVFCKENLVSVIVGNDMVLMLDRKNSKIQLTAFGHMFQMTPADGVVLTASDSGTSLNGIQLFPNGQVAIWGTQVTIGGHNTPPTPATAVIMGPSGITGIPAPNVFIVPG